MLALFTSVAAFQGPSALPRGAVSRSTSAPRMESANIVDLPGAAQETGGKVFDPLGLSKMCPYGSENFEWMRTAEIKHGRVCMLASVGWIATEMGARFGGNLATDVPFADMPGGASAWGAVPTWGKAQIIAVCGLIEIANECKKPHYLNAGMPLFDNPKTAKSRLSELKNGRLAMIGVGSFMAHHLIGPQAVPVLPAGWS